MTRAARDAVGVATRGTTTPIARVSLLLAATIAWSACDTPTAARPSFAYDPTTLSRGVLYRWPSGRTIKVWATDESAGTITSLGLATRHAIELWNAVPSFGEFTLVSVAQGADADIVIYDRVLPLPIVPGACAFDAQGAAGYTYLCADPNAPGTAQHFVFASGARGVASVVIRLDRGRAADQAAYARLVMHELGHALGIGGHSDRATDIMFGLPLVDAPSRSDVQTLRSLLGRHPDLTL